MNRTQRAIKKHLREIQAAKKREEHRKRDEVSFSYNRSKREELRRCAARERELKQWHRKILDDYAVNENKEARTA